MNIFGTDGIRGKVNQWPMTVELIQKVAISAASIYFGKGGSNLNRVIIGKDTRLSGYMLEPALVAGFSSMGHKDIMISWASLKQIALCICTAR